MPKFGPIWAKMSHFLILDKKAKPSFFSTPETRLRAKNQESPMRGFQKKMQKTSVFGILGENWPNWAQKGQFQNIR